VSGLVKRFSITLDEYPHLLAEWHPQKNKGVDPTKIGYKSHRRFWWKCAKGHEWEQGVDNRTKPNHLGCPICSGKRVSSEYNLEKHFPEIAKEWHPTKNLPDTPLSTSPKTPKKVWWMCLKGHAYFASVAARTDRGDGCTICSGKVVIYETSLAAQLPEVASLWCYEKNHGLSPNDISPASGKKVWWQCDKGHQWDAFPYSLKDGARCPYCAGRRVTPEESFGALQPEIAAEWHPTKNGKRTPFQFTTGSGQKVWWQCSNGHEWNTTIHSRVGQSSNCPLCSRQTSKPDLRIYAEAQLLFDGVELRSRVHRYEVDVAIPDLKVAIEYDGAYFHRQKSVKDKNKNKQLEKHGWNLIRVREQPLEKIREHDTIINGALSKSDLNKVFSEVLKISKNKSYQDTVQAYMANENYINDELYKQYLSYYPRPIPEKSLSVLHPGVSKEWHHEKNGSLTPELFTPGTHEKVWWVCKKGHSYKASIAKRTIEGTGCPICGGRIASDEVNAGNNPILAAEYHPTKNEKPLSSFRPTSHKKVWWSCKNGHEWQASIGKRSIGRRCPYCAGSLPTEENNFAATHPAIAKQWHPSKNGTLLPKDVLPKTHRKVWWLCEEGHEWEAQVSVRAKPNSKCPVCIGLQFDKNENLAIKYPELMAEWHPKKNSSLEPRKLHPKTHKKVWWRCTRGHEWETSVANRTNRGSGCPYCAGQLPSKEINLAVKHPDLVAEWHPTKNSQFKPEDFLSGSGKKVWWQCAEGHEWQALIYKRASGKNKCPTCKRTNRNAL